MSSNEGETVKQEHSLENKLKPDIAMSWIITLLTNPEQHNEKCSYRVGNRVFLCDCAMLKGLIETCEVLRPLVDQAIAEKEKEFVEDLENILGVFYRLDEEDTRKIIAGMIAKYQPPTNGKEHV